MLNFFKSFGKGILYVLVLPVLLVILGLYAIFALFGFIYLTIKSIILFFTGRSLFDDLPEDKKAKAIIKANTINPDDYVAEGDMPYVEEKKEEPIIEQTRAPFIAEPSANEDPFYVPEYLRPEQESKVETTIQEEDEEETINENDFLFEKVEREEINETPVEETPIEVKEEKENIPYVHTDYNENNDDYEDDDDGNWNSTDTLRL